MTDIVERLRASDWGMGLGREAASEIERLRGERDIQRDLAKKYYAAANRGLPETLSAIKPLCDAIDEADARIASLEKEKKDWKDNYNKATDACVALRAENARLRERLRSDCVALRAENARLRERLRFDDEEPYAHIDSLRAENVKLREALELIYANPDAEPYPKSWEIARVALVSEEKE